MNAPVQLVQARMLRKQVTAPDATGYTFRFYVRPQGTSADWTNVFNEGPSETKGWPSVDFYPGQTRLHIRSNTASGPVVADPPSPLPMNTWTHVAIVHGVHSLSVYLNGTLAISTPSGPPAAIAGPLYASDPWHGAANAQMFDLRYYSSAIDPATIATWVAHHP